MGGYFSILVVFYIVMIGISIYAFVLYVKLANRGIKALDIYINEKTSRDLQNS